MGDQLYGALTSPVPIHHSVLSSLDIPPYCKYNKYDILIYGFCYIYLPIGN